MEITEEQQKTFEDNKKLVYHVLIDMMGIGPENHEFDMCTMVGMDALVLAIASYDSSRGVAFTTYTCRVIRNNILNYLRLSAVHNGGPNLLRIDDDPDLYAVEDQRVFSDEFVWNEYERDMMSLAHERLLKESPRDQIIFNKYLLGESCASIAREFGLTRSAITKKILKMKKAIRVDKLDKQYNLV